MALADTANLLVKLSLGGNFLSQIGKVNKSVNQFEKNATRAFRAGEQIGTGIKNAGRIAAVGIGFVASQVALGLDSLIKLEEQTAQTNAAIKSTGGVAGVTAAEVRRLAESYESLNATIGDETIQQAENLLLTFTNIRKEAFEPTLKAILDMNARLGGGPEGLAGIAQLVGRALDNPEKGLQLLERRIGKFTIAERALIKEAVEQNRLFDAQAVILDKLNSKYGGSFLAQGSTTAGKIAKFTDSIEDLQRALAEALLPTLGNVADALSKTLQDPKVVQGVRDFGKSLAGLISPENLAEAGRILGDVFSAARAAAPTIAASAQIMGQVVGTAVGLFRSLPKEIQQLAIGAFAINKLTGGLVTNLAGGLISSVLRQLVSGVVNVSGGVVNVVGGPGLIGDVAGKGKGPTSLIPAIGIAGLVTALAVPLGEAFAAALPAELKGPGGRGESESQRRLREAREAIARQDRERRQAALGPLTSRIGGLSPDARQERNDAAKLAAEIHRAGERSANAIANVRIPAPSVDVDVKVNVTPYQVTKATTTQTRYGPSGGSRNQPQRHFGQGGV